MNATSLTEPDLIARREGFAGIIRLARFALGTLSREGRG